MGFVKIFNQDKMATQLYVKPPPDAGKKKKWSFGNLFKRREPRRSVSSSSDSLSSDQDRVGRKKGGFLSRRKKRHNRGSKDVTDSFTVIAPPNNPSLVPPGTQRAGSAPSVPPPPPLVGTPESGRSGSLTSLEGRRRIKAKVEASRELLGAASSSGEEDERPHLAHTCGSWPHSKRTRAARTERYIRRLSKDSIEGPETTAWKKWRPTTHSASTSPAHSPAPGRGNSKYSFRSASYDGNLLSGVRQSPTPPPPPPPPRRYDPPRPMSYAFEAEAPDPTRNTGGSLGRSRAYRTGSERLIPSSGPRPQHPFHNQNRPLRHLHGPTNSSIDRNRPPQQHPIPAPRTSLKLPITHHSRSQDNSASRGDVLVRPYNYNVPVSLVTSEKPAGEPRLPLVKLDNNVRNAENLINNNYYYHPSRTAVTASPKDGNGTRRQYICEPKLTNGFLMGEQCHQQNERIKPPQDATEFWRQQELRAVRSSTLSSNGRTTERNCSDSPRPKDLLQRAYHLRSDSGGSTQSEASSAVSSLTRMKEDDVRPLSIVVEKFEQSDMENNTKLKPPAPPERKSSRQSSVSSNADFEKRSSGNLEDALNELEEIYRTLKLGEEDVAPEDIQRPGFRGTESDTGFNYDPDRNKSARMTDDMAYRRLNKKEVNCLQDSRELVSRAGSYLLVSPTLSPPSLFSFCQDPGNEPDITKDDVVYRNINHTNNTLKISDPQPPFGIPLGPVTPAPESDYLHATPSATPLPEASPDIVTDDLAFRNLRKDSTQESTLSLKKKKAVRSLSANLSSYIKREYDTSSFNTSSSTLSGHEVNNNNLSSTESLKPTVIPAKTVTRLGGAEGLRLAHRMLDNRRRALFKNDSEEKNTSPRVIECRVTAERINTPTKEELRRKFFSDAYRDLEKSKESNVLRQMEEKTEAELLRQLEDEARATSRQIGLLQRQQSSGQHRDDTKSVAQLLKELTKSLDQDFGKACKACQMSRVDDGAESVAQCSDDEIVPPVDSADSGVLLT